MPKAVAFFVAIAVGCVQPPRPAATPPRATIEHIALTDSARGRIVSAVIAGRLWATGRDVAVDGCSVRHALSDRPDFMMLLSNDVRRNVLRETESPCGNYGRKMGRGTFVIDSIIQTGPQTARVDADFVSAGGSHTEIYTLRGSNSSMGIIWGLIEIKFSQFVLI